MHSVAEETGHQHYFMNLLTTTHIFMLEQFRCTKKQSGRLLRSKSLPNIKQINDPGK